jgi:hypothetical protein
VGKKREKVEGEEKHKDSAALSTFQALTAKDHHPTTSKVGVWLFFLLFPGFNSNSTHANLRCINNHEDCRDSKAGKGNHNKRAVARATEKERGS